MSPPASGLRGKALTRISQHVWAFFVDCRKGGASQAAEKLVRAGAERYDGLCGRNLFWSAVPRCGTALARASLLAGNDTLGFNPREPARGEESGSKLPHSKVPPKITGKTSFSAACSAPPESPLPPSVGPAPRPSGPVVRNAR
jgi:hypothetical protein